MSADLDSLARMSDLTLANWRTAGFTARAFRTIPALIPTARIAADPARAPELPEAPRPLDGFGVEPAPGKRFDLPRLLAATATDAFVVLHDGKIVHETYANGLDAETPHILMSMSKAVTGLVAGLLQAAGKLDVEAPVSALVPEIADTSYRGATIRHLLDMRARAVFDPPTLAAYAAATGWEAPAADGAPPDLGAFFAGMARVPGNHGGAFKYDSANTDLLGIAMERATGRSFAQLVSELLWQPMGARRDAFVTVDGRGAARCSGGVGAAARDVARLGQLIFEGGRDLVPQDVVDDLWNGGDAEAWTKGEFGQSFRAMKLGSMRYRSGWYVIDDAPRTLFAMGIHGQNLFIVPSHRLVIAKLSSLATAIDPMAIVLAHRAVAEIARLVAA